jgi:hypothetical protein
MSFEGRVEKVSRCCKARVDWKMSSCGYSCGDSWASSSACGKGSWPHGVSTDHIYIPSDYEKALEARLEALEEIVSGLKSQQETDPYQSPEYAAFVESMVQYCHCEPFDLRPCDGVLAGGLCDGAKERDEFEEAHFGNDED